MELHDLSAEEFYRILTEPQNAITKQYTALLSTEGVSVTFTDEALHEIAKLALARKTGARGLRSICEQLLQKTMFDLPSEKDVERVVVTAAAVRGEEEPQRVHRAA